MAVCAHCGKRDVDTRQVHYEELSNRLSFCNQKCYNDWQEEEKATYMKAELAAEAAEEAKVEPKPAAKRGRPPKKRP